MIKDLYAYNLKEKYIIKKFCADNSEVILLIIKYLKRCQVNQLTTAAIFHKFAILM